MSPPVDNVADEIAAMTRGLSAFHAEVMEDAITRHLTRHYDLREMRIEHRPDSEGPDGECRFNQQFLVVRGEDVFWTWCELHEKDGEYSIHRYAEPVPIYCDTPIYRGVIT